MMAYQVMKMLEWITLWTSISSSCFSSLRFFFGAWPLPILPAGGVGKPARWKNSEDRFSSLDDSSNSQIFANIQKEKCVEQH